MTPVDPASAKQTASLTTPAAYLPSSLESQWATIAKLLRKDIGDVAFRSWVSPLSVLELENSILRIAVPTRFIRDWVDTHYTHKIQMLWADCFAPLGGVEWVVQPSSSPAPQDQKSKIQEPPANQNQGTTQFVSSELDARYTFDHFVVGPSNELAFAAATRVAEQTDELSFNPLFITGGVGLGKTHLLHAIAWQMQALQPDRRVLYLTAEKFMYQFVRALRFKDTVTFKENFRTLDVLMIDDIQFIAGKGSTQEEFIHTFNALIEAGKQIVVAADRGPAELDGLDERLRSRLGWGLVADIKPATTQLRRDILEAKRKALKIFIPNDVLDFLAENITSSIRELEGALNRLAAHADLMGRAITRPVAEELLRDLLQSRVQHLSMEDIQRAVAKYFDITLSDMMSQRRLRALARPRQVAMYLCKQLTPRSLPEIGRKFGGRDHTTVLHAVRKIEQLMTEDPALCDDIQAIKNGLNR